MPVITLTADWGTSDFYAAAVYGSILSIAPGSTIVATSRSIIPHDLLQAAYILRNCWYTFPGGTIHLVELQAHLNNSTIICFQFNGHWFIGPNNGFFSLVLNLENLSIVSLGKVNGTFPAKDLYPAIVEKIVNGAKINELGEIEQHVIDKLQQMPVVEGNKIRGNVQFVDGYGNLISNISSQLFEQTAQGRQFVIDFKTMQFESKKISTSYGRVPEGEIVALFNSENLLEIAINGDKASQLLGMRIGDIIRVEFI